jgi:hypothetical protein
MFVTAQYFVDSSLQLFGQLFTMIVALIHDFREVLYDTKLCAYLTLEIININYLSKCHYTTF